MSWMGFFLDFFQKSPILSLTSFPGKPLIPRGNQASVRINVSYANENMANSEKF